MIIIDIINSIFDILPQLILATSPAYVFAGMGSGSQSGKLTFKKIFSGEGINITQDNTSLMFQVTGGSNAIGIDSCEIVMGNSITGITGSTNIKTCEAYKAITGVRVISGTFSPLSYSLLNQSRTSIIIAGRSNCIESNSQYSSIIGGNLNCINKSVPYSYYGTILGGCRNKICEGSGTIITSRCSTIYGASVNSNLIVGGFKNLISTTSNINYTSIIGGCFNRMYDMRYSSIINSCYSNVKNNFATSINSIGVTKLESPMFVDIGGDGNTSQCTLNEQFTSISSRKSQLSRRAEDTSIISSYASCAYQATASSIISSICSNISDTIYGSIISSCSSKILGTNSTNSHFNSIISSNKGVILNSGGSSVISSYGATVSFSISSTILSSCCGVIRNSIGSVLSNIRGDYAGTGIYNSTFSVAFFRQCFFINNSVNSVGITGVKGEMNCSINSASIGLNDLIQKGGKPGYRNFILSFDTACIMSDGLTSSDNFASGCFSCICDTHRSSIISSTCAYMSDSQDSSIIGSYNSCIIGSTSSVIIGSRFTKISNSRNSAIIAGWPNSCLSGCCETTRTAHLNIESSLVINGSNAISYCYWSGPISSITVCRGIITDIS